MTQKTKETTLNPELMKWDLAKLATEIIIIIFIGSFIYNIAFFLGLGFSLNNIPNIPLGTQDIVDSFVKWLYDAILLTIAGGIIAALAATVIEWKFFKHFLVLIALLMSMAYIWLGTSSRGLAYLFGFGLAAYVLLRTAKENEPFVKSLLSILLVIFLITAFFSGYSAGRFPADNLPTATIKQENQLLKVRSIRMIGKGVLTIDGKTQQLVLYPWEKVVNVDIGKTTVMSR